ncbi:MAG: hypothetical protein WA817_08390 [Candidatus Acidiferrum sp.]
MLVALIFALASVALPAHAQEKARAPAKPTAGPAEEKTKRNGILLGTQWESPGDVEATQRTWWIAEADGAIQVREVSGLLVPRKSGFWKAGTKSVEHERYIWAAPLGTEPPNRPAIEPACQDEQTNREFLFIGNDYIAVKEFGSATCAHYDESTRFYVVTLERPNPSEPDENEEKGIGDVLGANAAELLEKAAAAQKPAKSEDLDCGALSVRPTDWAIVRGKGEWTIQANGSYGGHVCDGYFATELDLKIGLPRSFVGDARLAMDWKSVAAAFPKAVDAIGAPNGHFLVVLTDAELLVVPVTGRKIVTVLARRSLQQGESVVMTQWATGENVARWDKQVKELQAKSAR